MVTYRLIISLWLLENKQWGSSDFGKENNFPISFNVLFVFNFSTYSTSGDYSNIRE